MPITIDHVKEVTRKAYASGEYKRLKGRERVAIFIRPTPLKAGMQLRIGYNTYKIEKEAFLVFVDLVHDANFSHPVLYELHNLEDGSIRTIKEEWPLADPGFEKSLVPHILPGKGGA
jgi:hypothetical protein